MSFKKKKIEKTKDLDLLPFMNLFAILIPFLLSVAVFEKLGILELNLPKRGMPTPDNSQNMVDPLKLNLTLIVTDEYLTVGAGGGFLPSFYYEEEIQYRSKSDNHVFKKVYEEGEKVVSPTDGKEMTPFEKEIIFLHYLDKKDSADPGSYINVAANSVGEPIVDTTGEWYTRIPAPGEMFQIVGQPALRTMTAQDNSLFKMKRLSAYDEVARNLWKIRRSAEKREAVPEDINDITLLASPKIIYDKIIHSMDAAKYAGFYKISMSLLGG